MIFNLYKISLRTFFITITLLFSLIGKSQDFIWVSKTEQQTSGYCSIKSITTDSNGNIYSTGSFSGTIDFDPSANSFTLICSNGTGVFSNGFILKLDKNKNFLWVKQIKSNWVDGGKSIILDKNENIIVTGLASGPQIDLNPSEIDKYMVYNPNLANEHGSYIIKLDPNGNFIFGNYYPEAFATESTLDSNNNIITTGVAGNSNVDFDAGNGVYTLTSTNNSSDIFVLKNNSNGEFIWAKNIGGTRYDSPTSIVCDNFNNIILTGSFETNISFLNKNYTSNNDCSFICKIKSDGENLWFKQLGDFGGSGGDKSIKIDSSNNIYFGTSFSSYYKPFSPNFNNINLTLTSITTDSILFKINENGDYIWHNIIYGREWQNLGSLVLDKNENLYVIANVSTEAFINEKCNKVFPNKNTNDSRGNILLKFNKSGDFINFKNISISGYSLNCDFEDNILIGGFCSGLPDFDPSPNSTFYINNTSYSDGCILKLKNCTSSIPEGDPYQTFCPNKSPSIANLQPCSSNINWYDSTTANSPLPKNSPLIDGKIYYAAYLESCDNSSRLSVTAHISQSPQNPIFTSPVFCKSEQKKLSDIIINGANISWYNSLTGVVKLSETTILENNITYYASQTENGCESERIPITVIINETVSPTTTSPQIFCIQQNATINNITITGQNIKWYDALTNGNIHANTTSLQNGKTYYASQTINGCESERIAVLINIQNTPAPTGDTNQSFCSTQNATLNDIEITGTNMKWYNSSNIEIPNTTIINNNTTYYATQTINNCESINKLAINTTLINTLNANNYKVEFCDENNDEKETINLSEFNPNLITNPSDNSFSYYTSLTAAENQIVNNRINNSNNYVLPTGSYTVFVRIDSPNGCHQVVELGLNLYSRPIIPINDITPICEGSSITVNAGAGYDNYLWSTGETSPTITIQNPGDYSVTATNNYDLVSCSSTKDFTVKKSTAATITTIETQDWTDNQNTIKVFVTGEGDFEYSIDGIHFQDSNEFSNVITGQYTVLVRDKNGCGTVTEEVYLLMYPKFFTPNGDGYNDNWKIKFSDSEKNITIKIFDRYGKLLKALLPDASWNGQFNNQELPATDYWFIATRADGKEYKGHFSLKR